MNKPVHAIYGASGCGRGVMPLLRSQRPSSDVDLIFVDDAKTRPVCNGYRVLTFEQFIEIDSPEKLVSIAIADPVVRAKLAKKCEAQGIGFQSIFADQHVVMDDVEIAEGAIFSPFTTVTSNIRIGRHFHCNINSYVEHDCVIGDFVTFAPGVKCNGNIVIEDFSYIGSGAVIKQGSSGSPLTIGKNSVIGMGAVVTKNVPAGSVVFGNPAAPQNPA